MNIYRKTLVILSALFFLSPLATPMSAEEQRPSKEDVLRAKVVDYMHTAASIQWTPKEDVPYYNPEQNFVFKKGETYYGIPYTQFSRNNDLETFSTQLEMIDGVQYYVGPCEFDKYWGSDCSASLSNAWKQADPNFPSLLTRRMIPDRPKEIVPVGKYVLNFHDSTPDIVKENGFDVMKEAYALLKPADAVIKHVDYDGHAMLVISNDHENERLFISDQTGLYQGMPKGRNGHSTFRYNQEYAYEDLFKEGYIPVALKVIDDAAHEIELFNGQNLDGWNVQIAGEGSPDNQDVFTVQDGILRISGEKWGGIMTRESYENYRLTVEFKWGEATWGRRKDKARDSGVLIHSFGPQNSVGDVWAKSVEANVIEGGLGDFWIVGGENDGISGTCDAVLRNGTYVFDPKNGKPVTFTANSEGRFQSNRASDNWQDVTGFRGPCDVDYANDWNTMEIYAVDDEMRVFVNGKYVIRVYGLKQTSGKIQLQSEGAEIFFRRVSLRPWNEPLD